MTIGSRKEPMTKIKIFIVFSVRSFYLSVVTRSIRTDKLVFYAVLFQGNLKKSRVLIIRRVRLPLNELRAVIGLDTLNLKWKIFQHVVKKKCAAMGAVFFKYLHITEPRVFINGSILVQTQARISKTRTRDKLNIDLDPLAGVLHLFIRTIILLRIRQLNRDKANAL